MKKLIYILSFLLTFSSFGQRKKTSFIQNTSSTTSVIPLAYIVDYWNMDGDSNGYYGNDGTDGGTLSYQSSVGVVSDCVSYDANGAIITVANSSDQFSGGNGTTDNAFSVSFWNKWDSIGNDFLVSIRDTSGAQWEIGHFSGGIRVRLLSGGVVTNRKESLRTYSFSTATWYHICVTYSGTSYPTIYIDGSSGTQSDSTTGTYVAMDANSGSMQFGGVGFNASFTMNGDQDEIVFCNVELSSGEVTDLYDAGIAGTPILTY